MRDSATIQAKPNCMAEGNPRRGANFHFSSKSPQGVTESLHAPLLTVEVPGSNPGVGANF